jgi:hypothetical protein
MPENGLVRVFVDELLPPFFAAIALLHKLLGLFVCLFLLLDWRFCGARVRERVWGKKPWLAQMIYTTLDTFYVSHQQMLDSPSRRDGVDENVENLLRIYGCEIIQECGILLKLYIYISLSHQFYCPGFLTFGAFSLICV